MSDKILVDRFSPCDFCAEEGRATPARYDGKTLMRYWANMCEKHFKFYGVGLGTGRGQELVMEEKDDS